MVNFIKQLIDGRVVYKPVLLNERLTLPVLSLSLFGSGPLYRVVGGGGNRDPWEPFTTVPADKPDDWRP